MSEIAELQQSIRDFVKARDWDQFHTPKNLAMSVAIEAGELMEVFQWTTTEEANDPVFVEQHRAEVEDEVADVLIYVLSLANKCEIDIPTIVRRKMARNDVRFPPNRVKGRLPDPEMDQRNSP